LYLLLRLPEFEDPDGGTLVFPLEYGRAELSEVWTKAKPEDIPIKPGATYIFTIHPGQVPAWERAVREENRPQPKIIQLKFQKMSFGDATGFAGSDGQALPNKLNKQRRYRRPTRPHSEAMLNYKLEVITTINRSKKVGVTR
ncbi:MAG: hypothetical protein ACRD8U_08745, partial [Pyrinomonadaceae bacterium]